jgi:lysophospholipase L1-like esterase
MPTSRRRAVLLAAAAVVSLAMSGVALVVASTPAVAAPAVNPAAAADPAPAALGNGSPTDPNIVYIGRWDTSSSALYVPNWTGAYLQTMFTGTTVKIKQRNSVNMYVSIDGGQDVFYAAVRGTVNLTPQALPSGTHRLRVSYRSGDGIFQGLLFDPGAGTVNPNVSTKLVEFVGDSITAGFSASKLALSAYGWVLGEKLGVRHTQIARSGYCLVGQSGCVGQSTQFFQIASTGTTGWDFSRYQASAVVINLGTNDVGHSVTGPQFQSAYTAFLRDIRARYPNAVLFVMETFKRRYLAETRAAVTARNTAGDANVRFINTEGWLTVGTDYTDTDGHPNDAGHIKVANRLAPIIAPAIGVPAAAALGAATPAAAPPGRPAACTGNSPVVCHFAVAPGNYQVEAWVGDPGLAGNTSISVEARRRLLTAVSTAAGAVTQHSFTVNVRQPEGQPTGQGGTGTAGLDVTFGGSAPRVSGLTVAPATRPLVAYLAGDSTVCDQPTAPYTGWGQILTTRVGSGAVVANYGDSGESSGSFLNNATLFPTMRPLIRSGDLVFIQFGHNDKTTTAAGYRNNLTAMINGVRGRGGVPVLVTPPVRRLFSGTQLTDTALHVNSLGVHLPAEMKSVGAAQNVPVIDLTAKSEVLVESLGPSASARLYLTAAADGVTDNTHFSELGATQMTDLVVQGIRENHLPLVGFLR